MRARANRITYLPIILFICIPLFSTAKSLPQNSATISSYGVVSLDQVMLYKGVWTSDPFWTPYGKYFQQPQVDLITNSGGNLIILAVNVKAWSDNSIAPALNKPFREYLADVVAMIHDADAKAVICLHAWGLEYDDPYVCEHGINLGKWWSNEKAHVIKEHRQEWINFGKEMVSNCKPWGMLVMDEPPRHNTITQQEYWDFAYECIEAWRDIDPSLVVFTYGGGGPNGMLDISYFFTNPLPQAGIYYIMTFYYESAYYYGSNYDDLYAAGDLANARQVLFDLMDTKLGSLKSQCIINVGVRSTTYANWQAFMSDVYEYNELYTLGYMQWACTKGTDWNMLTQDYTNWNEIGQFWATDGPTP